LPKSEVILTNAAPRSDRRASPRRYDARLPDLWPLRLLEDAIAVDFVARDVRGSLPLDTRVSPRRVLAWLRSMPSYQAGVPLRLGHAADAALAFEKAAELIELVDPARSVVYRTRRPLSPEARAFFAAPRHNLLLHATATPRRAAHGGADPLDLVASAAGLDPRGVHWVVGPLAAGDEAEALRILEALPRGSRLSLAPAGPAGPQAPGAPAPLEAEALARLEAAAHARGHHVSDFTCRGGPARVGRGFPGVDRLTGQVDLVRRAHDLITCAGCPSRTQCHGVLDEAALLGRLSRELGVLGLTPAGAPLRTGPRALRVDVAEPASRGDEAYLSHALGQVVAVTLASHARGPRPDGRAADAAVLRRWYATGFLPVTELNAAAERVLEDLRRRASRDAS
jgi:hypothetical protein